MHRTVAVLAILGIVLCAAAVEGASDRPPWWKERKIVFMWGQWERTWKTGCTPDELMARLARAGTTVYAESRPRPESTELIANNKPLTLRQGTGVYFDLEVARAARRHGIRYFGAAWLSNLADFAAEHPHRLSRQPDGKPYSGTWGRVITYPCPLDKQLYEKWFLAPCLEAAETGQVDGLHLDWEAYAGRGEAKVCYCDDCFDVFSGRRGVEREAPPVAQRYDWLTAQGLLRDYETLFAQRRATMFRGFAEGVRALQPGFVFSGYTLLDTEMTRNLHSDSAPFMILDARHYSNDDRQAWWESYGTALRKRGYIYIPGGWTNALFGSQPSQISAARWLYEAAINEDGVWLWFEHELDDEILRAYATADREIQGVLRQVGRFLFHGERDGTFATAVEWTGRPELEGAVRLQTFQIDDEYLVHVDNTNAEWPLRVRIRLPGLPQAEQRWTVRDALKDLYYSRDGASTEWTRRDLLAGVVVALEPRTDLFLLIAPAPETLEVDPSALLQSREFSTFPSHAAAAALASPVKATVNLYFMKNAVCGAELNTLLASTREVLGLPADGWHFKMDKDDVGAGQGWFLPVTTIADWTPIEIETFWGNKGTTGSGWYRRDVDIPALPENRRIYLHFAAVDEELVLWIDGEYAGDYNLGPGGWDKPFAIDVTKPLTQGKHHLALRVHNSAAAGGIWKPVSVLAGVATAAADTVAPETEPAPARTGRLICTVAEPLDFNVGSGSYTIGNALRTVHNGDESQLRVRHVKAHLWSPRYSPDGQRVAFVQDLGGRGQIFVMRADGAEATNISRNAFCDRFPKWSPDAEKIVFVSDRGGDWDVYTMNSDGSVQERVAGNPGLDRAPAWSPDGSQIAWESHVSGMPNIWVCDVDGGNSRPLIEAGKPLKISVVQGWLDPIRIVEAEPILPGNEFYLTEPVWAPDSRRIAGVGLSHGTMVCILDADGTTMLQLIPWLPGAADLCWSPDGTQLAGSWRTAHQETEHSGIFVIRADGMEKTPRGMGHWLVDVTPRGPRLSRVQRHPSVTWYSHGSSQPRRVVKTFTSLAWAADGSELAFSSDMDPSGAFHVYTMRAAGGKPRCLGGTRSAWPNEVMWEPH